MDDGLLRASSLAVVGFVIGGTVAALSFCYFGYCLLKGKPGRQPRPVTRRE